MVSLYVVLKERSRKKGLERAKMVVRKLTVTTKKGRQKIERKLQPFGASFRLAPALVHLGHIKHKQGKNVASVLMRLCAMSVDDEHSHGSQQVDGSDYQRGRVR